MSFFPSLWAVYFKSEFILLIFLFWLQIVMKVELVAIVIMIEFEHFILFIIYSHI